MAETVLPGVSIEVRAEALIIPLGITIGTLGVVGTASKGTIDKPEILGSFSEAQEKFGDYDPWNDGAGELTLVRALELAFNHGATTAIAVRVADESSAEASKLTLKSGADNVVTLVAKSPGTWGRDIEVKVENAEDPAFVENEKVDGTPKKLDFAEVVKSARNRIRVKPAGGGVEQSLTIKHNESAGPGEVNIKPDGELDLGSPIDANDEVFADYMVQADKARKITLRYGNTEEVYNVVSGSDLIRDLEESSLVEGKKENTFKPESLPDLLSFTRLTGGKNGVAGAKYEDGLDVLLNEPAHIIVAAGQDDTKVGAQLVTHCQQASSDLLKRDRIAVVGSKKDASLSDLQGHTLNSDRVIFVGPGITVTDRAATPTPENPDRKATLPGAYAAAAVAGLIASFEPHMSPTNKVLPVGGLEKVFTLPELRSLVQSRVLTLEKRDGFRIVKGITTSTDTAWHQITTRRIVDYAKAGVRSAANPFIGKLNNERVRGALRSSINSFLADMIESEMLISYELDVSATRQQEIRGIVQVTMVLRPTFSIDFIRVTIFLE